MVKWLAELSKLLEDMLDESFEYSLTFDDVFVVSLDGCALVESTMEVGEIDFIYTIVVILSGFELTKG